jgi:hypothetical protein
MSEGVGDAVNSALAVGLGTEPSDGLTVGLAMVLADTSGFCDTLPFSESHDISVIIISSSRADKALIILRFFIFYLLLACSIA